MAVESYLWAQATPRIVQHNKRRYALRLENIFWRQLEQISKRRNERLGKIVADLAESYGGGVNLSSYIRGFCMAEAERDVTRYRLSAGNFDLLDIIRSAPSPGMLLNHERVILDVNQPMRDWLGDDAPIMRQQRFDIMFEPRVTRPLDETMMLMRTGQLKRTQIQVAYNDRMANVTLTALSVGNIFYCLVWLLPAANYRIVAR